MCYAVPGFSVSLDDFDASDRSHFLDLLIEQKKREKDAAENP